MTTDKPVDAPIAAPRKAELLHTDRFAAMKKASESVVSASDDLPNNIVGLSVFLVIKTLAEEWDGAINARSEKLSVSAMASEIDSVIEHLTNLKIGLSLEPGAEEKMRKALGLAHDQYPKAR